MTFVVILAREVFPNAGLICWEVFWERGGKILDEKVDKNDADVRNLRSVRDSTGTSCVREVAICCDTES